MHIGHDRPHDWEPPSPSPLGERVRARVGDYLGSRDPRTILDDVVVGDAAEIARTVVDRCPEPPGWRVRYLDAHAAGLLHWLRADHLAEPRANAEHGRALAFFLLLFRHYPDAVPASELAALAGAAAGYTEDQLDGPAFWAGSATGAIQAYDDAPDPALLHGAILLFRFAATGTDPADPYHAPYATALIRALRRLPDWAADPRVADEVLANARRCVDAKPPDDTDRVVYVAQLVDVLTSIYLATGDSSRIDEAVAIGTSQLDGPTPVHRIAIHTATATALHSRYIDTDALPDLHRVIELERKAVELADAMPDSRANLLSALADSLVSLYMRTEEDAVGREAVEIQRRAADAATPGTEQHAQLSFQLAGTLFARFQQTRDRADFDAAVRAAQVGSRVRDIDRADVARRHGLVALTCHLRYDLTAGVGDLRRAEQAYQAAADAAAQDDPARAAYLLSRTEVLRLLSDATGDTALLDGITEICRDAAAIATTPAGDRLRATIGWARGEARQGRYQAAVTAYREAIRLLPLAVWHGLVRSDREYLLTSTAGLGSEAAAAALAAGDAPLALELVEEGRAVLLRQAIDYRSGPALLRARHPDLARELALTRRRLDVPTNPQRVGGLDDRRGLAQRWDALVDRARGLDGFESFLSATPFARLRAAAANGPVVVVNISELRSDALMLTRSGLDVIPLPDATPDAINEQCAQLDAALDLIDRDPRAPQPQLVAVLTWLGRHIAAPVLDAIALPDPPRLWWCPTGQLSALPLHAALLPDGNAVFDRCIPSYTATLRTLLDGRAANHAPPLPPLVVGLTRSIDRAGDHPLPSANAEVDNVSSYLPDPVVLRDATATRAAVLGGLRSASWFHFAGHAEQRTWQDGGPMLHCWDAPLTAADIATMPLDHADVAVLSACETAFGDVELRDEVSHLAGAFQAAGFRHVVATQWVVNDRRARAAVAALYRVVTEPGHTPNASGVPAALRQVLRTERDANPDRPWLWAPYVHFGP